MTEQNDKHALAFEFVMGTLSRDERAAVIADMQTDSELAEEVKFWEAAMMPAPETVAPIPPEPQTFRNIVNTIERRNSSRASTSEVSFWQKLLPWKLATTGAFAMLLVVSALFFTDGFLPRGASSLNTDYVAVLVDQEENPVLTALTASDGSTLWLKWEDWQTPEGHSLQLWSQSRRDGEIRPLIVFEGDEMQQVALDQATLRLIQDSSHLIITREETGGSALDIPSEQVIAKGVCIRLAAANPNA